MAKIVDTPLDNLYIQGDGLVTKKELRDVLAKAHITNVEPETNAILEVFVVDEINIDDVPEFVRGRFVYSQNDDEELRLFRPMNSNIIQYPLVGEEWLGFTYKDVHYYLSRLSDSNVSINYKKDGSNQRLVSPFTNNKDVKDNFADRELKPYGKTFVDLAPLSPPYEEGKTLLQGRFGNYIQLGSNQPSSPNSPNVRIAADNKTFISLTTDEPQPTYPVGIDFETYETYGGEQIFLNSNRITLNAKKNKVGIYSRDDINISSDRGNVLIEAADRIRLRPRRSTIDLDIENGGTILTTTKPGIPFPQLEMMGFLKMMFGISDFFKGMLLGVPKLVNPFTIPLGVKEIMKGLKGAEAFIQAIIGLEFLSMSRLETKTIEEIKAVLPIPAGFGGIIDDVSNITDEQIKKLEELEKASSEQLQKASQLQSAISTVPPSAAAVSGLLADGSFDSFDGVGDLKGVLGDNPSDEALGRYISNGGLSGFENQVSGISGNIGMADQARSYQNIFKARS